MVSRGRCQRSLANSRECVSYYWSHTFLANYNIIEYYMAADTFGKIARTDWLFCGPESRCSGQRTFGQTGNFKSTNPSDRLREMRTG